MIVYGDLCEDKNTVQCIDGLMHLASTFDATREHELATDLLIQYGEFETGVTDRLCKDFDTLNSVIRQLRSGGVMTGRLFAGSWRRNRRISVVDLVDLLDRLRCIPLPESITVKVPEGYAFYGLYPEFYYESALKFVRDVQLTHAVCIGIRSIGTSLASVIVAALESAGCPATSFTVRPRGDFFDREIHLSDELAMEIDGNAGAWFLIADEGPGLSGSSFASVAGELSRRGIPDERIILFPSWNPDGNGFISRKATEQWQRHRKFLTEFEELWLDSGLFRQSWAYDSVSDISAGKWRPIFLEDESEYPPVYPQNERRKYLVSSNGFSGNKKILIKFAGLGHYGRATYSRALLLAERGFSPRVLGLKNGFIGYELVSGKPLTKENVCRSFMQTAARYLAFLKRQFPARATRTPEQIREMIVHNLTETAGRYWVEKFVETFPDISALKDVQAVAVDGRLLPHKWIKTEAGYLKTDVTDHHADHFFPCCQDIAWDVAGLCVEFGLDDDSRSEFVEMYSKLSEDSDIRYRLPFYTIAYIVYRLGYSVLSGDIMRNSPEGLRFNRAIQYYSVLFQKEMYKQMTQ
ncbi:hypothetical protein [Desulfomonile tiedjei]|uniref:Uncharacterized protein n=1 Tax=Desulfomonile tiedjei (strain ATCC 49306 / DSM 6799 / DCB-1) TaxID=706587 RepID=I4C678_DESTA|nr:hypothetical protein [Desulfomonile tiedjei]AFM25069.1 hypothetical protein Desti_2385 [Desulfomonile tiedjei DSM 6799]